MKSKRIIITMLFILSIIIIITLGLSFYKKNSERKLINKIETQISDGYYEEAIKSINESSSNDKLMLYKNILDEFLEIKKEIDNEKSKEKIDIFKGKYTSNLDEDIFGKLNEEILKIEQNIDNYYSEIEQAKQNILIAINNDIYSAKELMDAFKEKYTNEDISDIEDTYNKKLEEIKKEEEKKKQEESKKEENQQNINSEDNNSTSTNIAELSISNTSASTYSSQIITVVSNGGSYGELAFWEKDSSGKWILVDKVAARLGQNGMKSANEVYEMDKCTPTGIYSLTEAFGINANPGSKIKYRQLDGTEYWIDDVNSQFYNTMQFGEPNGRWNSAEKLIDYPGYYNYSLVIDYNRWPVVPGKSSAIFLHCDIGTYTYGCVAIPQGNLVNIISRLDPEKNPFIIMDFSYEDIYTKY